MFVAAVSQTVRTSGSAFGFYVLCGMFHYSMMHAFIDERLNREAPTSTEYKGPYIIWTFCRLGRYCLGTFLNRRLVGKIRQKSKVRESTNRNYDVKYDLSPQNAWADSLWKMVIG